MRPIRNYISTHGLSMFLSLVAYMVLIAVGLTFLIMAKYPFEPVCAIKIETDKKELFRGEEIGFILQGEKLMPIPVHVNIDLCNGTCMNIMNYSSNQPVGKIITHRSFIMPHNAKIGKHQIRWAGTFKVNSLQDVYRVYYSDWIDVK